MCVYMCVCFRLSRGTFEILLAETAPMLFKPDGASGGIPKLIPEKTDADLLVVRKQPVFDEGSVNAIWSFKINYICVGLHRVTRAVCSKKDKIIKWLSARRRQEIIQGFEDACHMSPILGAIDDTHVRIVNPPDGHQDYYNRKGFPSLQLQLVVDDLLFINDAYVG